MAKRSQLLCSTGMFSDYSDVSSLLNRFRNSQDRCGACRKRWHLTDSDLCSCGRDPDNVSHCRLMPFDEGGWRYV